MTDSDKLVKYFETKYAPYKVEMCEAVWKSNFSGHFGSMAWRLTKVHAIFLRIT